MAVSGAREELKILLNKYPQDIDVHLTAARFYKTTGLAGLAQAEYKRAIDLGCKKIEPFIALSEICLANLDNKQALEYANKAIAMDPTAKEARVVLVSALLNEGKLKEAQEELIKGFAGNNPQLCYLAYRLHCQRGHFSYAKQFLDDAIKLDPKQTHWLLDRADLYQLLGDESNNPNEKMRDYIEAKRALEMFLEKEPKSIEGLFKLGRMLESYFYDYDQAMMEYKKILDIDPDYVAASTGLDRCKRGKNDLAGQMKLEFWKTVSQPLNALRDRFAPKHSLY